MLPAEPATTEIQATDVLIESAVEEPASLAEAPVQESLANEVEAPSEIDILSAEAETPEPLITEHASIGEESTAAAEGRSVDEQPLILEEHAQETPSLEPEVEAAGVVESQEAIGDGLLLNGAQLEVPPIDESSENFASGALLPPTEVSVSDAAAVEPESEVAPFEPSSGKQQVIEAVADESSVAEAVRVIKEVDQ